MEGKAKQNKYWILWTRWQPSGSLVRPDGIPLQSFMLTSSCSPPPPSWACPRLPPSFYYIQACKNYLVQVAFWFYRSPSPHHKMSLELEPLLNLSTTEPKHLPFSSTALFCALPLQPSKNYFANELHYALSLLTLLSQHKSFDCSCCLFI